MEYMRPGRVVIGRMVTFFPSTVNSTIPSVV
jgi:hypothetical protein